MTDQVEVQEKVRWEDLEVEEEPRYFEGLGDAAAQIHQELCGEITEWEEGNEPVPTYQEQLTDTSNEIWLIAAAKEYNMTPAEFVEYCGGRVDSAVSFAQGNLIVSELAAGEAIAQGLVIVFGIPAEEFAEAMEGLARAALETEIDYLNTPVLDWREASERLPYIGMMVAGIGAFCTPSRINLTGIEE